MTPKMWFPPKVGGRGVLPGSFLNLQIGNIILSRPATPLGWGRIYGLTPLPSTSPALDHSSSGSLHDLIFCIVRLVSKILSRVDMGVEPSLRHTFRHTLPTHPRQPPSDITSDIPSDIPFRHTPPPPQQEKSLNIPSEIPFRHTFRHILCHRGPF